MVIRKTAGGIVIGKDGKVVIVNQNNNSWSLPKGHIEPDETAREAAAREIKEEAGISNIEYICDLGAYKRHRIPLDKGREDPNEIKEITMFLYKTDQEKLSPEDPHNPEARWVEINQVADILTHQKDKEFFISQIPLIKQRLAEL